MRVTEYKAKIRNIFMQMRREPLHKMYKNFAQQKIT